MEPREEPGRLRRLAVTAVPIGLTGAVPAAITLGHAERIGHKMFTGAIMMIVLLVVVISAVCLGMAATYRQSAAMQGRAAILANVLGGLYSTVMTLHVVLLIDAPEPADIGWFGMSATPLWVWPVGVIVAVAAGVVARRLTRPGPPPVATEAPPAGAVSLDLGARQKAVFTTARWLPEYAVPGATYLAVGAILTVQAPAFGPVMFICGAALMAQAHVRLFIDGTSVTLVTAGVVRRNVPYEHVQQADALADSPPARFFPPAGGAHGFGASTGKGPAFGLRLTDGRRFVFSTAEAATAAALVNGFLRRDRTPC